jgi:3alpha(or 20beta)-hydroxysteroid dehydrogenase
MTASDGRLRGRVAIVTGAARGQGAAHARRLVAEGASVTLADVLEQEGRAVADQLNERAAFVALDVTDKDGWLTVVAETIDRFGPPTILVNNAGLLVPGSIVDQHVETFLKVVHTNLLGVFLGIQTVAPVMADAGGGSIINIGSTCALEGNPSVAAYASSKWAIRGLTKVAALELAKHGIRVNAVHPGPVDTPMMPHAADIARFADQPIPRAAAPDELAGVVAFLASDDAGFSTGADFVADGGMTVGRYGPSARVAVPVEA